MSRSDDDILADELGEVGASSGELMGGPIGAARVFAGRVGGRLGAKLLSSDTYETSSTVVAELPTVISTITTFLNNEGKLLGTQEVSGTFEVKGLVGSGFSNMNPTILAISIGQEAQNKVHVTIRGTAKEGLVKQHSAEKAVLRIVQYLEQGI